MADESLKPTDLERLFGAATELSSYAIEEGDVPVVATTPGGTLVKIPERMLGRAEAEGITPVEGEAGARTARKLRIQEEQAGVIPAIVAGTEEALSTATFGATDAAMMGLASLAGTSREDYLRARAERQEGSPTASAIGTAVGLIAPAILTEGGSLALEGAAAATTAAKVAARAKQAAGFAGVGGVMKVGRLATGAAEIATAKLLPSVMTTEELAQAFRAARLAGSTTAAPGLRAVAATALKTGAERAAAGAVEGALWGVGEGVRESILGQSDDVAEAVLSHVKADSLLFSELGGTLGVLEGGLPWALNGARKVANRLYDKLPAFGRDSLRAKWIAEPGRTGVAAETAEELLAQRERLVAVDDRFGGVLDSLAASSPDAVRAASSHVEAVEALAASRKGALDSVLAAPPEVRDTILENFTSAIGFEARAKGALEQLVASTPDRLQAAFAKGAALDALMAGDKKALGRMLELKSDTLSAALDNIEGIAALEEVTGNRAITTIARMRPDAAKWYVANAGKIAQMEVGLPGYWQVFRGMTKGAESEFAITQADDILANWNRALINTQERARVATETIQNKAAEIDAGEKLSMELYRVSQAVESEAFLKVGEIGGPPSIEAVQMAAFDIAAEAESIAKRVSDVVTYDAKLSKELADLSTSIRRDFVGLTEAELKAGIEDRSATFLSDPAATFERIKDYRRNLGARIRKLEAKRLQLSPGAEDTLDVMIELRDSMTRVYHNPAVFGDAAVSRAKADDAFRRWKQATEKNGLFDKLFRETMIEDGVQKRVIARKKVNTWLNQMGDARDDAEVLARLGNNSSAWAEVSDAFSNLIRTTEELIPKVGRATIEINPEELQALARRTIDATKELEQRGFYTRELFQMKAHVDGGGALNLVGLPTNLPTMGGFPHGVPTAWTSAGRPVPGGLAPEVAAVADAAATAASVVPGGGLAARGLKGLLSIPTQQRQVAARVRGMVAIESMGRKLADGIEEGARWLVGEATGKKILAGAAFSALTESKRDPEAERLAREQARREAGAARAARARRASGAASEPEQPSPEVLEQDRMIREANRLAADPAALAELIERQSGVLGRELPESSAAVGRLMGRAAKVIARAAPVPEGQPLDSWQPSAADRAALTRVVTATSRPLELFQRAYDGTLTRDEVDAVGEVAPSTLARMRAAAQAHVEAARVEGRQLSAQHRRGIETLLGYPLTTGSARPSVAKYQGVFGNARAGKSERPSDGMVNPLPGAAKVTLGNRYLTPQQAAAER